LSKFLQKFAQSGHPDDKQVHEHFGRAKNRTLVGLKKYQKLSKTFVFAEKL
jgi:hypothetical protein